MSDHVEQQKCYVRHFYYNDGNVRTFHTVCDHWDLPEQSDEYGRQLEPNKELVEVSDEVHFV